MLNMNVLHYGVHLTQSKVAYLMQGRGGTNAIGLKEKAPFIVRLPSGKKHCNHQLPLATPVPNDYHWNFFTSLLDDQLVRAMLPIPKRDGGTYFIEETGSDLETILVLLSKLSSPIYNVVVPVQKLNEEDINTALQETNVQPLVITSVKGEHSEIVTQTTKASINLPRKLVIAGQEGMVVPPTVRRITTRLTSGHYDCSNLMALPWESLGAVVVRKFMRGEWCLQGSDDKTS